LTVFAIRDVGLSIAFPLWNTNSLVGLFWGWLLFSELRGAGRNCWAKVLGGAVAIVAGACVLAYATSQHAAGSTQRAMAGILAALGAGLLWGTMYIPYRKAYLSGMNPLSFVTVFTVGELATMSGLAVVFRGGFASLAQEISQARPALFWLFLGGFCWVLGDLFQQYAAKYIGIGRGIPLSNTNQLWGLAWGALVFGELSGCGRSTQALVIVGSVTMILGALAISVAVAPTTERASWSRAMRRECERYRLDSRQVEAALAGQDPMADKSRGTGWRWLDIPIVMVAAGIFVWLARGTTRPPIAISPAWTVTLVIAMLALLIFCGGLLWKRTRFS
jgi:drug/metabolite transporter (DMT)-like permease